MVCAVKKRRYLEEQKRRQLQQQGDKSILVSKSGVNKGKYAFIFGNGMKLAVPCVWCWIVLKVEREALRVIAALPKTLYDVTDMVLRKRLAKEGLVYTSEFGLKSICWVYRPNNLIVLNATREWASLLLNSDLN